MEKDKKNEVSRRTFLAGTGAVLAAGLLSKYTSSIKTIEAAPSPPTNVSATDGTWSDKVRISWTASPGATGYKVYRNTTNNSGTATLITASPVSSSPYDDTSIPHDSYEYGIYCYWVKARDGSGDSGYSNMDSGWKLTQPLGNPVNLAVYDEVGGLYTLKFGAAESLAQYSCYWRASPYNRWFYDFKVSGNAAVRYADYGWDSNSIMSATIEVQKWDNPNHIVIDLPAMTNVIGSIPESGGSSADYASASAVLGYTISQLLSSFPWISFAWNTVSLVANLRSIYDVNGDTATKISRSWNYSNEHDVQEYMWFEAGVDPYYSASFQVNYKLTWYPNASRNVNMTTIECVLPELSPPRLMKIEEKEKYGIEEIPINEIRDRAPELGISQEKVDEFIKSGESVIYFAHKAPVAFKTIKN